MSGSLPKVTVIICGDESEEGFAETLQSVVSQQYPGLSYLVVDGPTKEISPFVQLNKGIAEVVEAAKDDARPQWICCLLAGECLATETRLREVFALPQAAEARAITDGRLVPFSVPFQQSAMLIRLDAGAFDEDYSFAADYAMLYRLYHQEGARSVLCVEQPLATAKRVHPWRGFYSRYIKGEQLGIQSEHISWRWVKDYICWKMLNK